MTVNMVVSVPGNLLCWIKESLVFIFKLSYHRAVKALLLQFLRSLIRSFQDLLPIILVVSFFQFAVLQQPLPNVAKMLAGIFIVMLGLTFFIQGLKLALFPLGEEMAFNFVRAGNLWWLFLFAFTLGFGTTVAEPALIAISNEAAEIAAVGGMISNNETAQASYALGLRLTVALAVGVSLLIGVLRILKGWPVQYVIIGGYIGVVVTNTTDSFVLSLLVAITIRSMRDKKPPTPWLKDSGMKVSVSER